MTVAILFAADLIAERLKARCPAAAGNVFAAPDLAGVQEKDQKTPALQVLLHSYEPLSDDAGASSRWREIYLVVAVVKNARRLGAVEAIRNAAGGLLQEAIAALDGWKCPGAIGLVRAIAPPRPAITDSFGYFPLAFEVHTVSDGADGQP